MLLDLPLNLTTKIKDARAALYSKNSLAIAQEMYPRLSVKAILLTVGNVARKPIGLGILSESVPDSPLFLSEFAKPSGHCTAAIAYINLTLVERGNILMQ